MAIYAVVNVQGWHRRLGLNVRGGATRRIEKGEIAISHV